MIFSTRPRALWVSLLIALPLSAASPLQKGKGEEELASILELYHSHPAAQFTLPRGAKPELIYPQNSTAPSSLEEVLKRLQAEPDLFADEEDYFSPLLNRRPKSGRWILIEVDQQTLSIMQDEQPIKVYRNVATGRGGVGWLKIRDDEKSVLGAYYINFINLSSQYHAFFRFAYPTHAHFEYALDKGLISEEDYDAAMEHYRRHRAFPQETILGGYLGIHGLGEADYETHQRFNWTRGCIALTNEQIEALRKEIDIGTWVVIE
jgi:hypothetical protein